MKYFVIAALLGLAYVDSGAVNAVARFRPQGVSFIQ